MKDIVSFLKDPITSDPQGTGNFAGLQKGDGRYLAYDQSEGWRIVHLDLFQRCPQSAWLTTIRAQLLAELQRLKSLDDVQLDMPTLVKFMTLVETVDRLWTDRGTSQSSGLDLLQQSLSDRLSRLQLPLAPLSTNKPGCLETVGAVLQKTWTGLSLVCGYIGSYFNSPNMTPAAPIPSSLTQIAQTKMELRQEDMLNLPVDCVVNAANPHLKLNGQSGTAGAIWQAGGQEIENQCQTILNGRTQLAPGEAIITGVGPYWKRSQSIQHIVHTVGPVYDPTKAAQCKTDLTSAVTNALIQAKTRGVKTIAFPLISAGIYGYPRNEALQIIWQTISKYVTNNPGHFGAIYLVIYEKDKYLSDYAVLFPGSLKAPSREQPPAILPKNLSIDFVESAKPKQKFSKAEELKDKQAAHLKKLQALTRMTPPQWCDIREHTQHMDSAFDWWMFPTDRSSQACGDRYQMSQSEIDELKKDRAFMKSYREGVILVAKSWGWDLEKGEEISWRNNEQKWTNYQVRLGKMLHSLMLFGEDDLRRKLTQFVIANKIKLEEWIRPYLLVK